MGIKIEAIVSALAGIRTAETPKERERHAAKLIAESKESIRILTRNPEGYCNPALKKVLSETIERQVLVEVISVDEEHHRDALNSLASLGIKVYKAREWPQTTSGFIVVDEKNCQVAEHYQAGQEPKMVYTIHNFKNAPELTLLFETVKEQAVQLQS